MRLKIILICSLALLLFLGFYKILAADESQHPIDIPAQAPTSPAIAYNNEFNRIALCESSGQLHAKNSLSSASGEFQWINSSWYHYGKELWGEEFYTKNIWTSDNRELAWYVYNKYGTKDWNASKWCWNMIK